MPAQTDRTRVAINIWTARIIPVVLAAVVGYATYVMSVILCVDYLLFHRNAASAAIPILTVYYIFFLLMTISFFRLLYITAFDPPYVPLRSSTVRDRSESYGRTSPVKIDAAKGEYNSDPKDGRESQPPQNNLESPGLESFYTKDVFVVEMDGKPRWCSECSNWKPDRAHHCSSSGRCILRMDHFCPWVGGPIGENNFKFFIQFTGYTALYCIHILIVSAIFIRQQISTPGEELNKQLIAVLVLSSFFGVFTAGMTATSVDLALKNQTQVEKLGAKTKIYVLAVFKPLTVNPARLSSAADSEYQQITYPLGSVPSPLNGGFASSFNPGNESQFHTREASPRFGLRQDQELSGSTLSSIPGASPISFDALPGVPPVSNLQHGSSNIGNSFTSDEANEVVVAKNTSEEIQTEKSLNENRWPTNEVAARDLKAIRTFGVLRMLEPGDNPWDLGSYLSNWEIVMGLSLWDWLLPIRRSPCCNHENSESYYTVGPLVDQLRAKFNIMPPTEIRARGVRQSKSKSYT